MIKPILFSREIDKKNLSRGQDQDEALECTLPFSLILGFFLLFSDVRNVLNKCTAEKPCEVNAGDCTFDDECRGNLICTKNNCEGSTLSLNAKCCQEPGGDIFYIIIWFGNGGSFLLFVPIMCFSRDSIRNGSHFESKSCIHPQYFERQQWQRVSKKKYIDVF